ncbi:MAG: YcgL domain-containing protein [Xanthomonadales bacterium]|nr:YcgL domain-containing protein [Xanthomonadales bacterium]
MTPCKVYRSDKQTETYLYLSHELDFADLPEELQERFGVPALVMRLELSADRKLARVDVGKVLESLSENGFYLQLPPKLPVEEEIARRFS